MPIDTKSSNIEQSAQSSNEPDATRLVNAMQSTLNGLETTLKTFNQQSNVFNACANTNLDRTTELQDLHTRLRNHRKAQNRHISGAKKTIRQDFKDAVTNRLRSDISARIRSEVALQVKGQVNVQIQEYIPVPLHQQVVNNKKQIHEVKVALINSEARARNSALETTNLDEPLMPILKLDGVPSNLYPADLRSLFSYDLNMVKELVNDFEIEEDDSLQVNYERFMRHIGFISKTS
ncbi:hypothetical protein H0H87_008666 [Tephrocybe sp. NHM501043]|nr:hypothetical protein H0H87_008666 [Tephrocybe sp. NHM501043]